MEEYVHQLCHTMIVHRGLLVVDHFRAFCIITQTFGWVNPPVASVMCCDSALCNGIASLLLDKIYCMLLLLGYICCTAAYKASGSALQSVCMCRPAVASLCTTALPVRDASLCYSDGER
jgi:hypothetical protein